jgi:hypothetical protein
MTKRIPVPVLAVASDVLSDAFSHEQLNQMFLRANAPGEPPPGSKLKKCREWFGIINREMPDDALQVFGRVIEEFMEVPPREPMWPGEEVVDPHAKRKEKLARMMEEHGLQYSKGGRIIHAGIGTATRTLADVIKKRDWPAIHDEFNRAIESASAKPRDAVSAASNILEAVCKEYIDSHGSKMPAKTDLRGVWTVVREELNFNPANIADDDLKRILSGLASIIDGVSALRTHASTAHAPDPKLKGYNLEPRHARLAINAAHSVVAFIIESWDKQKAKVNG